MDKIKVMHLIASTSIAGAENVLKTLLDNVDRSIFEHHIANFVDLRVREPNPFRSLLVDNGYFVEEVPIVRVYDWRQVSRISYLLKKNNIDLLHTNGYRSDFLGYIAARKAGIPILTTAHGSAHFPNRLAIKARLRLNVWMKVLKKFDKIIAVSKALREQIIGFGIPAKKVIMLRNAAPMPDLKAVSPREHLRKKLGIDATTKLIGTVGRLSHEKGHEYLIQSIPSCLENGADIRCILVGDGPRRGALEKLAAELCPPGTVEFLGHRDDVQDIYPALDVFVLPSLIEGTPMALLEAMGWRVPIVATAVGGIPDIIKNDFNGVLVQPGNSAGLARGIRKILSNKDLGQQMADRNIDLLEKEFDVGKWVKTIESIYLSLTFEKSAVAGRAG